LEDLPAEGTEFEPTVREGPHMPIAESHIQTPDPSRYLVQLCRHAAGINQRGHRLRLHTGRSRARPEVLRVEYSDTDATLRLDWGQCTMRAGGDTLSLRLEAADEASLGRLQELLTADLERFGARERLTVDWRRPGQAS
jgi:hypothetical protein